MSPDCLGFCRICVGPWREPGEPVRSLWSEMSLWGFSFRAVGH